METLCFTLVDWIWKSFSLAKKGRVKQSDLSDIMFQKYQKPIGLPIPISAYSYWSSWTDKPRIPQCITMYTPLPHWRLDMHTLSGDSIRYSKNVVGLVSPTNKKVYRQSSADKVVCLSIPVTTRHSITLIRPGSGRPEARTRPDRGPSRARCTALY